MKFSFRYRRIDMPKKSEGGWSGIGMVNSGIDPTHVYFLNDRPTQIPPSEILGPVVQNCQQVLLLKGDELNFRLRLKGGYRKQFFFLNMTRRTFNPGGFLLCIPSSRDRLPLSYAFLGVEVVPALNNGEPSLLRFCGE